MSIALLDVNVLVALVWPTHESHNKVKNPVSTARKRRLGNLPGDSGRLGADCVKFGILAECGANNAISLLKANVAHASHRIWRDEIGFVEAAKPFAARITGHQRITDAYLLGLAVHKKGKLLTWTGEQVF
jgi:uncharacterized protein